MKEKEFISTRQLMAVSFVGLMSPIMRRLPEASINVGGGAASWLAPVAAIIPLLFILWVISRLMNARKEGEGLTDVFIKILGGRLGKLLTLVFALWFLFYAGFILRSGSERLMSVVYRSSSVGVFMVITLVICIVGAYGKLRSLACASEVFVLFLGVILIIVFAFSISEVKAENLLPVSYLDTVPVMRASVPVIYSISPIAFFAFLSGGVRKEKKALKVTMKWTGLLLAVVMILMLTTIGTFGASLTGQIYSSFFAMVRNISIFNTVERIESVIVAVWVIADFVMISALLMAACKILSTVFGGHRRSYTIPCGVVAVLFACLLAPNAFVLEHIFERLIPAVTLVLVYIVLPVTLLIGKVRKKLI